MHALSQIRRALWLVAIAATLPFAAFADAPKIGVVLMHGKGGAPTRLVDGLAFALEGKGMLVANIEMPWSARRDYDVDTAAAEQEIGTALAGLKAQGAQKLFVAGHSQGGAFALHYGSRHPVDGVICIAPGGDVATPFYAEKIGAALDAARRLVAAGKGKEKAQLSDFESSRGAYPVIATPENYLSWFDASGAMNMARAARQVKVPVLWLVAERDYPGLRKTNIPLFQSFPAHPLHRMGEPAADHKGAPAASSDLIVEWAAVVANAQP